MTGDGDAKSAGHLIALRMNVWRLIAMYMEDLRGERTGGNDPLKGLSPLKAEHVA